MRKIQNVIYKVASGQTIADTRHNHISSIRVREYGGMEHVDSVWEKELHIHFKDGTTDVLDAKCIERVTYV